MAAALFRPAPFSPTSEEEVEQAQREWLAAVEASVEASKALLRAGPGERTRAHFEFMHAHRRQAAAERAYERARQRAHNVPSSAWPRMKLY